MDDVTRGRIESFDSSPQWFVAKADDVEARAAWTTAAHVESPPKKKKPPTP